MAITVRIMWVFLIEAMMQCTVMQSNYVLRLIEIDIALPCRVVDALSALKTNGCIENDQSYTYSVYGRRMALNDVLQCGDRLDLVIPLPVSPVERRRALALKRKNR